MPHYPLLPEHRRPMLLEKLQRAPQLRLMEAHSPLAARIASLARPIGDQGPASGFDGLWMSSLGDSSIAGLPDTEVLGYPRRTQNVFELTKTTHLPLLVDADTGGELSSFIDFVHKLEQIGASGCVVEDKIFPKKNSLIKGADQQLADCDHFSEKIRAAQSEKISASFMVWARTEALIASQGMDEAVYRAESYIRAGADGIVIQSVDPTGQEVFTFMQALQGFTSSWNKPVWFACIPTAYPQFTAQELFAVGFHVVIFANHMLRASIQAMENVCSSILSDDRTLESEPHITSIHRLFHLIPQQRVLKQQLTHTQLVPEQADIPQ
ncbi:MAG TPA: isocitrate lyase/phosphoenolpyruvate mutase family protein [Oligoflexus sp.]|uniref:isocitrate lyase/phosphoenolpyruvate mutase family protein n=1 Tax=Oligoflexus sp. TaxID=1971216 RepID=UPI002D6BB524|nr:isocitrate lyase/phosphoenolpyruvate mutase family protein [Oligoflexus sp.]HYX35138.1 isocitrate lyase/phosphoenolpyruvate mutase family protein [Oligoflexus sp.]